MSGEIRQEYQSWYRGSDDNKRAFLDRLYRPDVSLGSPIYQYLTDCCRKIQPHWATDDISGGCNTVRSMLCANEASRWSGKTGSSIYLRPGHRGLYPDPQYDWSDPKGCLVDLTWSDQVIEPDWNDMEASKTWLERRYRPGDALVGSPLFRMYPRVLWFSIPWSN